MNKIKKYIVIVETVLLFFLSDTITAQTQFDNEFTVTLGMGSSSLKYQLEKEQSKPGFGWALGAGYTYYFNTMIGINAGLEIEMFTSSFDIKTISFDQQIPTPQGLSGNFLLRANYTGLKEKQTAILFQIPVMLQFQFPVNEKSFLFLGTGLKAGFPVSQKWNQNTDKLTTTGYSEYTNQSYENMPNHGFSTYSNSKTSGKLELKSPVLFALEGGLKFAISESKYLYTGVFLDYGLNNIYKTTDNKKALLEYNNASPADYNHNSILSSNQFAVSGGIKPFAAGVKIKLSFGSGKTKKGEKENDKSKDQKPRQRPDPVWGW